MEIKDIKQEMYHIITCKYHNTHNYSADVRVSAAQTFALLEIAESLKANRKEQGK